MLFRKNIVFMLLVSLLPIVLAVSLESWEEKGRRELSDFRVSELTFWASGRETDVETNQEMSYEGEIVDTEVIDRLWQIITEQQKQPEIKGGNYLSVVPYLELNAPNGACYKLSYTWDREETVYDEYGEPGISLVGRAFVINGTRSGKYQIISQEAEKEFEKLIMDYLQTNAIPKDGEEKPWQSAVKSKEKVWQKSARTDAIVFVDRYQNLAWGYQCNGYFIDCWGNVYAFDYSDRGGMSEEEFQQALWETYCDTEPVRQEVCDSEKMFNILLEDVYKIDRDAEISSQSVACDAGQRTLYVCDCDFEMIKLCSTGDVEEKLQDRTARKLCKYYINNVSTAYKPYH